MALRSAARNVSSTPCRRRTASIAAGARSSRVAAGASSMNTGSSVRLLTSSATCGRQNSALANQSPSAVVDSSPSATGAPFTRSRSFLVPRITSTRTVSRPQRGRSGRSGLLPKLLPDGLKSGRSGRAPSSTPIHESPAQRHFPTSTIIDEHPRNRSSSPPSPTGSDQDSRDPDGFDVQLPIGDRASAC